MAAWWETTGDAWDSLPAKAAAAEGEADQKWKAEETSGDKWAAASGDQEKAADDSWKASGSKWEAPSDDPWKKPEEAAASQSWSAGAPGLPEPEAAASDSWAKIWDDKGGHSGAWNADSKTDAWVAPAPNGKAFWEAQEQNKQYGTLSKKEEWELEQDDATLFSDMHVSTAGIDFGMYDAVPVDISGSKATHIPVMSTFEEIYKEFADCIPEALIENVRKCHYSRPTPVQKYAIPVGLVGRDVMCCAQTGSGKTAAFLIPIIGRMMKIHEQPMGVLTEPFEGKASPDTLIMTPTRELCIQIHDEAKKFCHRTLYRCVRVYGGEPPRVQLAELAKGCDLMVACPGRLQDFINREVVGMDKVYILVLDEADRMLDMGFEKQIRDIVENHGMNPKDQRQTMMFSATFPNECQTMAQDFLYDYIWIGCGIVGGAVESVSQRLEKVAPAEKYGKLIEILDEFFRTKSAGERCLVFVNAKDTAKWLDEQLYEKHFDTGALHGNLTQEEREANLRKFRSGEIEVMVATDVAARGLDIEKVAMVVNYDMPDNVDTYVHRIGRSGRIGNRGQAVTFIATDDNDQAFENLDVLKKLHGIMRDAKSDVPEWLEGTIDPNSAAAYADTGNSWKSWGGRDMRGQGDWN